MTNDGKYTIKEVSREPFVLLMLITELYFKEDGTVTPYEFDAGKNYLTIRAGETVVATEIVKRKKIFSGGSCNLYEITISLNSGQQLYKTNLQEYFIRHTRENYDVFLKWEKANDDLKAVREKLQTIEQTHSELTEELSLMVL